VTEKEYGEPVVVLDEAVANVEDLTVDHLPADSRCSRTGAPARAGEETPEMTTGAPAATRVAERVAVSDGDTVTDRSADRTAEPSTRHW
jgi:hypothetical protein